LGWSLESSKNKIIVLLNPNAGDMIPQRRWPMTHFHELAILLLQDPRVWILVTGSKDEKNHVEKFVQGLNQYRVKNFAGELKFFELAALYSQSDLLITNDSGPGHFSSVTNIKTFVLFGPETPDLYGPIGNSESYTLRMACSPCVSASNHRDTRCTNNLCMKNLKPEWIAKSAHDYFSKLSK
jgi:ADP-heptose:LPS heptosyltransferase